MQNDNSKHNHAYYRAVKTMESINDKTVAMYGVEGFGHGDVVSVLALTTDKTRITKLVATLNECGLELCQLRDVVDDFLYDMRKQPEETR